ncbi:MAG: response regulator transcription factor [Clostridium sp.]|nr:response regulator transcription factor [Clostridium sp.]
MEPSELFLLEDDDELRYLLSYHLTKEGYQITTASTVDEAMSYFKARRPKLAILDINLPDGNGFYLCKKIKEIYPFPIIFLTGNTKESDVLQGYHLGAEEYITKPFSIEVFKLKINTILKRIYSNSPDIPDFSDGHLYINFEKQVISVDGNTITVAASDFSLLKILIQEPNVVFSKEKLLDRVWKNQYEISEHAITESIHRLRNKLEDDKHKYFKTIYGLGYTWIEK